MPADYTIKKVNSGPREWSGQGGSTFHAYRCDLEGADGIKENVEVNYKPDSNPPKEGDSVFGDITDKGQYGLGFKKASQGGGGGGGGGRARPYRPRPDDVPEVFASRQAGIIRQHSQNMALRVLELAHNSGQNVGDVMATLGVRLTRDAGEGQEAPMMSVVEAFSHDVSLAAAEAWKRENDRNGIGGKVLELMKEGS